MTPEQEQHVNRLAATFHTTMRAKYEIGAQKHGGMIWDMTPLQLLDEAIFENIDQFVYLMTAKEKLLNERNTDTTAP